jgi:uncharacterized membrane protein YcaP (DUF421 family)
MILGFDIVKAFTPDVSLFEIFFRGTLIYFAIFVLLRVLLRGRTGSMTTTDLLVLVLIADAAQNAMSADYHSITAGLVLITTIIFWSFALDWLGYHIPALEGFVHPQRQPLVVHGRMIRRTLEHEMITEDELMSQLRLQGVERLEEVKVAYLEGTGDISVIKEGRKSGNSGGHKGSSKLQG